ncbi:MAG: SMC-Scp complex subunit ScpB, partial [Ferruginibacter sp.]|nr:SMC-Scp complex subunit ScpB [Ferruginibacter sp.]
LLEKDLVIISGRNEDAVGKPLIYATSKSFMDYFGINSAEELPRINEVLMEELVKSTAVSDAAKQHEIENQEIPAGIHISTEELSGVSIIEDEILESKTIYTEEVISSDEEQTNFSPDGEIKDDSREKGEDMPSEEDLNQK